MFEDFQQSAQLLTNHCVSSAATDASTFQTAIQELVSLCADFSRQTAGATSGSYEDGSAARQPQPVYSEATVDQLYWIAEAWMHVPRAFDAAHVVNTRAVV